MRIKKKPALILLMIVSMLCLIFGAVACGGGAAKDAIEMYILPENETLVSADFTLPKTIGKDVEVTWKSSNTNVITIEDGGEAYTAKVTLPTEVTPVTLTVSAGNHSKDFTVRVDAFSVYTFVKNFKFAQRNVAVKEGFDLETEMTLQGKKATITWAIDSQYSHLIKLNDAKNKVEVIPGEDVSPVEITATFTYDGKSADQTYPFSVSPVLKHLQTVNRYYSRTGYPLELSGYIVHVYEASESYGNATFYMIDDDFCSGYYCYRAKINTADIDKYVAGAHITFSGDTTKNYSGLWENNSGGTAVVDDKPSIDPKSKVYDLDTDLIANVPSLIWHESTYVRLTGWKVSEKAESKPKEGTTGTLFTLKKGGVSIDVTYTKYINFAEGEADKLINLYDTIEVGNFVTVTGLLGRHVSDSTAKSNAGFQVQPVLASDVVKVESEAANENGAKVKAAVEAVDDAVKKNVPSFIAADKEFELPTSKEGVTVSYEVVGATNPTVAINGGKFNVNPTTIEHNYDVQVTYSIGDYKAYGFFSVHNWKLTDKEIVEKVSSDLEYTFPEDVKSIGEYDPPVVDDLGATVTWAVKASSPSWISVVNGKIKVAFLPQQETEVILVATVTLNSESKSVEVPITILADPMVDFTRLEEPKAGEFIFSALHNEVRLYASSLELDGNYIATTNDADEAVKLTIEKSGENWLIKMGAKYLEVDPYKGSSGSTSYRLRLVDKATEGAVWVWDSDIKIFKQKPITTDAENAPAADAYFYIGMRDDATFTTMSPSDIKYISGDNAPKLDVTQHPSRFGTLEKITHRHFYEYTHTTGTWTHSGTCSQPGCDQTTITEDCRPEQNVCPKCGHEYTEAEILAKLFKLESGGSLLGTYKLKGKVKSIDTPYDDGKKNVTFTITVGGKDIQCFREKSEYSATVKVGDTVTVTGKLMNYGGKVEFDSNCAIVETDGTTTQPEEPEVGDPKTATDIDATGATVFDFAAVTTDTKVSTSEELLATFLNAASVGLTGVEGTQVYAGNNTDSGPEGYHSIGGFLKLGSSKNNGTIKLTFSKNVGKVQILCIGWNDTDTIAIDGFNAKAIGNTEKVAFIFELSKPVNTFTITTAKRALIFKIAVTFTGGTVEPGPEPPTLSDPKTATEIEATGATVFDFTDVTMQGAQDYAARTNEQVLAFFKDAATLGLTAVEAAQVYAGNNSDSGPEGYHSTGGLLKLGSSKNNGTIKLTFSKKVSKVQVLCIGWKDTDMIMVDGFNAKAIGNTEKVAFIFELSEPVDTFTITTTTRALIFKIAVTFADSAPAAATSVAPVAILPGKEF